MINTAFVALIDRATTVQDKPSTSGSPRLESLRLLQGLKRDSFNSVKSSSTFRSATLETSLAGVSSPRRLGFGPEALP